MVNIYFSYRKIENFVEYTLGQLLLKHVLHKYHIFWVGVIDGHLLQIEMHINYLIMNMLLIGIKFNLIFL